MKRRLQLNLLKLFATFVFFGSIVLITKKNYLPISTVATELKEKKDGIVEDIKKNREIQKFQEVTLPSFREIKKLGLFMEPTRAAFKHQLRHILDDYNISASVRFYDIFYDKIFPGFDITFFPININFSVYDEDSVYKLIHDINHQISYLISPIQLNIEKIKDKYIVDYKVFWIKGLPYGELSNLSSVESPWHFSES